MNISCLCENYPFRLFGFGYFGGFVNLDKFKCQIFSLMPNPCVGLAFQPIKSPFEQKSDIGKSWLCEIFDGDVDPMSV